MVYFFCGCERCQACARAWGAKQRALALPLDAAGRPLQTLVVYAGDAGAVRAFAAANGLDVKQTLLLPDADLRVTTDYGAGECPRAFVIDGDGYVRYTNNHPDDAPRTAPALVIVSNVVGAARFAASAPISLAPLAPLKTEPFRTGPLNPQALTVLGEESAASARPSQGRYAFGSLDVYAAHSIEHTFTLRNDTARPITLTRLGSSCGCTSAFLQPSSPGVADVSDRSAERKTEAKAGARILLPGDKIGVHVAVDASRLRSGMAKKLVWVFAQGSGQPVATLELAGAVRSPVTFAPAVLDFGRVTAGKTPFLTLTLTCDARLLRPGQSPPLVCTNPDVQVVPEPSPPVEAKSIEAKPAPPAASPPLTRSYRVQLASDAAPGRLSGTISFVQMPAASALSKGSHAAPTALLLGSPVILLGEVIADVKPQSGP